MKSRIALPAWLTVAVWLIIAGLGLSACGAGQGLEPKPLTCNIGMDGYSFEIAGEPGSFADGPHNGMGTNEHGDIQSGQTVKITVDLNFDRVYEISKHTYDFTGTIVGDKIANVVTYDITATGGTFASPQTCKKP